MNNRDGSPRIINRKILILTMSLVVILSVFLLLISNILYVRHWEYAYYGKSQDGNIQCEILFTTPPYKSLRSYLYYRQFVKPGDLLGKVYFKIKNQREYIYINQKSKDYVIEAWGFIKDTGKWQCLENLGSIGIKRNFIKNHTNFDLKIMISSGEPLSKENTVIIHCKITPIGGLPFIPDCNINITKNYNPLQ